MYFFSFTLHIILKENPPNNYFFHGMKFPLLGMIEYRLLGLTNYGKGRGIYMDKVEVGEVFSISDHEGQEQEVEVLGVIEIEGTEYVAVGFVEDIQSDDDEDIDIFFLKVDAEGELAAIESDEEFEKVSEAFDEILDAEGNIE